MRCDATLPPRVAPPQSGGLAGPSRGGDALPASHKKSPPREICSESPVIRGKSIPPSRCTLARRFFGSPLVQGTPCFGGDHTDVAAASVYANSRVATSPTYSVWLRPPFIILPGVATAPCFGGGYTDVAAAPVPAPPAIGGLSDATAVSVCVNTPVAPSLVCSVWPCFGGGHTDVAAAPVPAPPAIGGLSDATAVSVCVNTPVAPSLVCSVWPRPPIVILFVYTIAPWFGSGHTDVVAASVPAPRTFGGHSDAAASSVCVTTPSASTPSNSVWPRPPIVILIVCSIAPWFDGGHTGVAPASVGVNTRMVSAHVHLAWPLSPSGVPSDCVIALPWLAPSSSLHPDFVTAPCDRASFMSVATVATLARPGALCIALSVSFWPRSTPMSIRDDPQHQNLAIFSPLAIIAKFSLFFAIVIIAPQLSPNPRASRIRIMSSVYYARVTFYAGPSTTPPKQRQKKLCRVLVFYSSAEQSIWPKKKVIAHLAHVAAGSADDSFNTTPGTRIMINWLHGVAPTEERAQAFLVKSCEDHPFGGDEFPIARYQTYAAFAADVEGDGSAFDRRVMASYKIPSVKRARVGRRRHRRRRVRRTRRSRPGRRASVVDDPRRPDHHRLAFRGDVAAG